MTSSGACSCHWTLTPKDPLARLPPKSNGRSAFQQSEHIQQTLCALGWPAPAVVSTGNGVHRYFACDLPADNERDSLIRSFYACAAKKFSLPGVKLDTSVQNRARVMRLPGSVNVKAGRTVRIEIDSRCFPGNAGDVGIVTDHYGAVAQRAGLPHAQANRAAWSLDRRARGSVHAVARAGLSASRRDSSRSYVGLHLPVYSSHNGTSPALILTKTGWLKWACKHDSCQMTFRQFLGRLNALTGHVYGFGLEKK